MKKLLVALIAVACLGFPLTGFGASLDEIKFGIHGGVVLPQGDMDDAGADMGFTFGGQALMPSGIMDELMFGASADYMMGDGDYDMEYSGIELLGFGRFVAELSSDMQIFGQLGLGFLMWDTEAEVPSYYGTVKYEDDGTDFGFAIGGGLAFMENFEAVALYKSFDDADYISLTFGYNF